MYNVQSQLQQLDLISNNYFYCDCRIFDRENCYMKLSATCQQQLSLLYVQ